MTLPLADVAEARRRPSSIMQPSATAAAMAGTGRHRDLTLDVAGEPPLAEDLPRQPCVKFRPDGEDRRHARCAANPVAQNLKLLASDNKTCMSGLS